MSIASKISAIFQLEANIALVSNEPYQSESMPWQESVLISPKKTHGTLIKVATAYEVSDGKWVKKEGH